MTDSKSLEKALISALEQHIGGPVKIEDLHQLSGGAVAETWWFDAICQDERSELILRMDRAAHQGGSTSVSKTTEAKVQQAAYEAGVPAARVLFIVGEPEGLNEGYVMERIAGETIARKILRDEEYAEARTLMARQSGEILYRIHSVDKNILPPLPELPAATQLEHLQAMYQAFGEDHPVFDFAFRWLFDNLPKESPLTLVHSDFRNGNLIVGPEGIRAIIDWEMTHIGDPMEDLGWLCVNSWRFGNIDKPVGGFGEREDLFAGYEAAGGGPVNPEIVRFWEVFGTLKWGLICLIQAFTHLSGAKRSVELAAIGRRPSETEIDLLNLLT